MIVGKTAVGIQAKEIPWFWKPFIAYGKVTLIQGDTGIGKTSLMLRLMADATKGLKPPTQFMGRLEEEQESTEPLTVFYITTENGIEDTVIPMFDLYGGRRENLFFQDEDEGHFVLNAEEIESVVEQFGAKLIVVDPWQEFLDEFTSTNNDKLRTMVRDVQRVAKKTGAAVVFCGNFSKARGGSDLDKGLGGSAMAQTLRSVLTVSKDPYGNDRIRILKSSKMSFNGKEISPVGLRQEDDFTVSYIQWLDYKAGREKRTETVSDAKEQETGREENSEANSRIQTAVEFLKEALKNGPVDSAALYEKAREKGISRSTLNRAKRRAGVFSKKRGSRSSLWKLGVWI